MMKYKFRLTIAFFVYFFFKLTHSQGWPDFLLWDTIAVISLVFTMLAIMATWEIVSRSIAYFGSRTSLSSNRELYLIHGKTTLITTPFVVLFAFLYSLVLRNAFPGCCSEMEIEKGFWVNSAQGFIIALLIISYEIIRLYTRNAIRDAREKEQIKKELVAARYEGLKNQVNPHFLFNSFSVLSSLVEKDSDAAIQFISKLSDMYRYILENDEKSLVSVTEELNFLDDYFFLLKMRHQSAIVIDKQLNGVNQTASIPPLSLQILLENAVKHNSFSKDDPLLITLESTDNKTIQVTNKKVRKEDLSPSTGIGLSNLSKRLKLLVGKGLTIVEDDAIFRVSVPLN